MTGGWSSAADDAVVEEDEDDEDGGGGGGKVRSMGYASEDPFLLVQLRPSEIVHEPVCVCTGLG